MPESSSINGLISFGPSAQLMPMLKQRKMRNGIPICLHRLPGKRASAQVGDGEREHDRARAVPSSSNNLAMAKSAAFELSESKTVSTSSKSAPPSSKRPRLLVIGLDQLIVRHPARRRIC